MKKRKIRIWPLIIHAVSMAFVIAVLVVANQLTSTFELSITQELCPEIVDSEEKEESGVSGQEMSSLVLEEGITMLKNNGVLPLSKATSPRVNVFGWRSVEWAYGSVGTSASGAVNAEDGDASKNVDLLKSLTMYGVEYNEELQNMYRSYYEPYNLATNAKASNVANMTRLVEPPIGTKVEPNRTYYTNAILANAKSYSETALVVIGRLTGENWNCPVDKQTKAGNGVTTDATRHYLELTKEEEDLLTYVGENYDKVVVIINTGNVLECGFLDTIPGLDACLYVGYTGTRAANVIAKILYGDVSPSGHTVDTWAYDLFTNPSNIFNAPLKYSNYNRNYIDLIENIYIGYKWYETADTMGYWSQYGGYDSIVKFPFGYGLSYSTFEWTIDSFSIAPNSSFTYGEKITIDVTVENKGEVEAKDVVEVYMSAPYISGGIEKSSIQLVAFAKTHAIEPGKTEKVTLEIDPYDFASYDCYDKNNNEHKGYELDAGDYTLSFRTDAHKLKNVKYNNSTVSGSFIFKLDETTNIDNDPVTGAHVANLFTGEDSLDKIPLDAKEADYDPEIPWLSRSAFPTLETIQSYYTARNASLNAQYDSLSATRKSEVASAWDNATTDIFGDPVDNSPTSWGVESNMRLTQSGLLTDLGKKLGENYDDPDWVPLLNQLSQDDVYTLINNYYGTKAISSIGKVQLTDYDGPAQVKGFKGNPPRGVGFPIMTMIASTWNLRLAYEFGKAFGDSTIAAGVNGVWGWAIDNHRCSFFARANESPSEDPVLAGRFIARAVKGFNTRGRYCFLKHFSFYVTGWNHNQYGKLATCIFDTEQGYRETTLKAFRYAFVEGEALGCMTSYEGMGAEHSETTEALLQGVLRKEWGFKGAITTDYISNYGSGRPTNALQLFVRSGGSLGMGCSITSDYGSSNRYQNRLKDVAKEILWTWLRAEYNSRYYAAHPDADDTYVHTTTIASWVWWKPVLYTFNTAVIAGLVIWAEMVVVNRILPSKRRKAKYERMNGGK